jgi:RNA polymerase sigma-70 factor (ECF subfamily)
MTRSDKALETYAAEAALLFDDDEIDFVICACLYKMLPTLNPDYADLIWRADLIGEDRSVIAHDLGLSENALRVKLHRARRAMRQRLEQTCLTCIEHGYFQCACPGAEDLRKRVEATALSIPPGQVVP